MHQYINGMVAEAENVKAGRNFGFQSVLVKTNHLEEHQEWQEINNNIK